jgi:hypothetical protein
VFGGCLDEEFATDSQRLFEEVRQGLHLLLVSDVVIRELQAAPQAVQSILLGLPRHFVLPVVVTAEIQALCDEYLRAGVVGRRWIDDATHVAAATVARADAIVSWNFQHIVHLDKMKAYNVVNLIQGYGFLTILTPKEVIEHGTDADEEDI